MPDAVMPMPLAFLDTLVPTFVVILGIGFLIFVHELGHFLVAKWCKVRVEAFSLGFGPRLFSFVRGETRYQVSAVPIGGFVKMLGEDPSEEIADEDWQRVLDTNLWATHAACQLFAPRMAEQEGGGSILNIGSVTAHLPLSKVYAYSASKAAVLNLTKNVAREYATRGVRVNSLCPGFVPAEQNRKILQPERVEKIMSQTPMDRFGEPHELVGATILLLSRAAGSFVTGTEIYVDGGFTGMRF